MKIYEIGTGYTPIPAQMGAATEIVVEELTRSFLKNGTDVEIIDIKSSERKATDLPIIEVSVPSFFTKKDVSLGIVHKLKRIIYSIALANKLKGLIKASSEKIVLHFHNQYNMFFFSKLLSKKLRNKVTVAYTVHSYIWGTQWDKIADTIKKRYFQEVYCVKNADLVFVLNDITTDHFVTKLGVDSDKIKKIINGVNISKYAPLSSQDNEGFKKSLSLDNKKIIFQVGSVCDRKNQLGTVKMLCSYLKTNNDVVFLYAGGIIDAEYKDKIDALAKENGIEEQIIYVGELSPGEELNRYYNIADCSVFTSNLESFGLVIIEAISSGTPVILSDNLMFDLKTGYSIYKNEDEFISLVNGAVVNKAKLTFDREEVLNKYNWDTVANEHISLFNSIN